MPALVTNVNGTGPVTVVPASGANDTYRDITSIVFSTTNAAVATLKLMDGGVDQTISGLGLLNVNWPNSAAAPLAPLAFRFNPPLQQSVPNQPWQVQASVNASGITVSVNFQERQ